MYFLQKFLTIVTGSLLISIGVNAFLVPYKLLDGGALGISLIFHYLMNVNVGLTFLLVSIPVFIIAWIFYRTFFFNGIHGMLLSSISIDVLSPLQIFGREWMTDPLLCAVSGGIFIGAGIGIMLRLDISIGGTDLLAQMMARKLSINPGVIIFCIDSLIVTIGSIVLQSSQLTLSLITVLFVGITTSLIVTTSSRVRNVKAFGK